MPALRDSVDRRKRTTGKEQVGKGGSPPLMANLTPEEFIGPSAGVNRPSLLVLFEFHLAW
jgi:hypothetical protein